MAGIRLRTAADAARLLAPRLEDCDEERAMVAHVAADGGLLHLSEWCGAGARHVDLPLRTIIADALRLGSAELVLAHCHPSGDPRPSAEDIAATRRLARVAGELDITLRDHLIFTRRDCRSLRGMGLL